VEHLLHVMKDKEFIVLHDGHTITSIQYFSTSFLSISSSG
jgi:hypothetical protein